MPVRWFAADSGYGRDPGLRAFCHERTVAYVMAVPCHLPLVSARGGATRPDKVLRAGGHVGGAAFGWIGHEGAAHL